jgi:hypothetical protein
MSAVSLESGLGTISFDGQVLELFGFGETESKRIHVGQVQGIELGNGPIGSMFVVDLGPASGALKMAMKLSDKDRAGLEALIAEVEAARSGGNG